MSDFKRQLLSSQARLQVPWVKVTIGDYTFGVFSRTKSKAKNSDDFYTAYNVQYPNFIQSLEIIKINGQVNQYTLSIIYPVTQFDDPNFFEKVFSSVSNTRKIVFTYGDAAQPTYVYKEEQAIITGVTQSFDLANSKISYTVKAVSSASLCTTGSYSFPHKYGKPSQEIKDIFKNPTYGLKDVFTGMSVGDLDMLIAGGDKEVYLDSKINISIIDYISYLVSCMVPEGSTLNNRSDEIYILTLHDDTTYDQLYANRKVINERELVGPYFMVTKTSTRMEQSDAYVIDVGYNTSTIVTNFSIDKNENYSIFYEYQKKLNPNEYRQTLDDNGNWSEIYAPAISSKNNVHNSTETDDITWWTKITKYPISATIVIQGLLRPAQLMTYVRLNVVFPGGHKHISSGLYIITKQVDKLDASGYRTTLSLTRISGDNDTQGVL